MSLIEAPRAPWIIRIAAWVGALLIGAGIVYLVFNFGYYASGLAALKEQEKLRKETPIRMEFADPNARPAVDPNAPPPAPAPPPDPGPG